MSVLFLKHPKETDLALFAGGESGPFARWRIERHVESCPQCQETAADFFRLPDQLNELADLPGVDWKQMAMSIEAGARADAAAVRPARRSGFPPLIWRAGLVAATVVVGVVVARYGDRPRPEPELIAAAKIEAPATAAQVEGQQEIVETEPARAEAATAALQSKAVETRQTFVSDIAAPAAPPPPPMALHETVVRRANSAAQPVAAEADSAEVRLRNDAAARVGSILALGGAAPAGAALDQAGVFRPARMAWAQLPVDTVNFDEAPISLSGGYTAFAGAIVKTPSVTTRNGSDRTVSGFDLVWIAGDGDAWATALVQRQGISMAPGAVASSGGDRTWRLPAGILSPKMRIYLSRVSFEDGTTWSPAPEQIASRGLIEAGSAFPEMELLPVVVERDDKP